MSSNINIMIYSLNYTNKIIQETCEKKGMIIDRKMVRVKLASQYQVNRLKRNSRLM